MVDKRIVARNAVCSWLSIAVNMAIGFVLMPFLVHRLREETYGLWILIASLTSYFNLFDLGVCNAVGWNIAYHRGKGDREGVNAILNTALAILAGVGGVVLLATFAVLALFF